MKAISELSWHNIVLIICSIGYAILQYLYLYELLSRTIIPKVNSTSIGIDVALVFCIVSILIVILNYSILQGKYLKLFISLPTIVATGIMIYLIIVGTIVTIGY